MSKKTKIIVIASVAVGLVVTLGLSLLFFVFVPKTTLFLKLNGLQAPTANEQALKYHTTTRLLIDDVIQSEQIINFEYRKTADGYDFHIEDEVQDVLVSDGTLYDNKLKNKRSISADEQNQLRKKTHDDFRRGIGSYRVRRIDFSSKY